MASTWPSSATGGPATYTSTGGTVTVQVINGRLTLVDRHANDGYQAVVEHDDGNVIRVRFKGDDRTPRIEVHYKDGTLTPAIDNDNDIGHGEGHGAGDGDHDGGWGSNAGGGSDDSD